MTSGIVVPRESVFVLKNGRTVVDWGDGRVQDILTGEFLPFEERDYGGALTDSELDVWRKNGRVESYDPRMVHLRPLPEPPRPTME
jgi:hypothetical protein